MVLLPLLLLVGALIAVLAGRAEEDPDRERPRALYLAVVTFVATTAFLVSVGAIAHGVTELTDDHRPTRVYRFDSGPMVQPAPGLRRVLPAPIVPDTRPRFIGAEAGRTNHDSDVSMIIGGLIAAALAAGVAKFHGSKLRELAANGGPGARIAARETYLVCGVTLLAALASVAAGAYAFYGLIAPDTAGVGSRADALRTMIGATIVGIAALALFARNWRRTEAPVAAAAAVSEEPAPVKKRAAKKAAPPTE